MNIITAGIGNLEQLIPLFDGYRVFYKQLSDQEAARVFLEDRLKKSDSIIFLALNEHHDAMGFTQLYPIFSSVSMRPLHVLNDLFVSEGFRGRHIGRSLLEHAKDYISEINSKGLILETAKNNPAQYLYERLDWKLDNDALHYTWENK